MQRLLIAALLLLVFAAPARAQENDDLLAGFKLGKFNAVTKLLAADLNYLDALVNELKIAEITDENYDNGQITEDDVFSAQLGLAYAIWRIQFMIQPLCESGLQDDSFEHPVLQEFKDPTQEIFRDLQGLCNDMLEGSNFSDLATFTGAVAEGQYVDKLMTMASQAAAKAGEEPEEQ
jgi:hypothetical protein